MQRIEISGNIASGKTTLCKNLSIQKLCPVLENFKENPFINQFYEDPSKYAFETEFVFLLLHYNSIKSHSNKTLTAFDFSLYQDIAYADVNLVGNRHKLFIEMTEELLKEVHPPSKIIHIICPEEVLLQRIKKRNREIEKAITIEYLKELSKAIQFRFDEIKNEIPVISINSHDNNFKNGLKVIKGSDFLSSF